MILSSIAGTLGAIVIGVPIGLLTAIFLSETANPILAKIVRPAVELLAGIPSVIYGFFGMLVIVPAIRKFPPFQGHTTGDSLLAAILILAIMVLPTIVNVSETALHAVPVSYREASLALGATQTTTIFKVTVPAAKSGILSGVILGVGRAIGETMAVIMVAGNVPNMPNLLGSVRFLTTGIAMEMSYSSGLHRQALFAIGLVLFVFIMIVNISFTYISKKGYSSMETNSLYCKHSRPKDTALKVLINLAAGVTVVVLVGIIGYILVNGLPYVTWQFISTPYSEMNPDQKASCP